MRRTIRTVALVVVSLSMAGSVVASESTAYPVKISDNGRFFVDHEGKPVFWLGITQCQLFREYKIEDARRIKHVQ